LRIADESNENYDEHMQQLKDGSEIKDADPEVEAGEVSEVSQEDIQKVEDALQPAQENEPGTISLFGRAKVVMGNILTGNVTRNQEKSKYRRWAKVAAGVGAVAAGYLVVSGKISHDNVQTIQPIDVPDIDLGTVDTASATEHSSVIEPQTFMVEGGHGFSQEIKDSFPGHSAQEYLKAHESMLQQFGPEYLDGVDTYTENGELRIQGAADSASWKPGVEEALKKFFSK
jgi:hypothetical protein